MASQRSAKNSANPTSLEEKILAGAMEAAIKIGWGRASLGDIAAAGGVTLADLHEYHADKAAILRGLVQHVDRKVLAGAEKDIDQSTSPRDRLFGVMMRRFDALKPYREGLAAISKDMGAVGVADAICGVQRVLRSLAWMLEAAGIGTGGFAGSLRVKGLAFVYASTFSTWLKDDSADMAKTMAALDKNLERAEKWANFFGRRKPDAAPEPAGA